MPIGSNLSPNTSLALMQAGQSDASVMARLKGAGAQKKDKAIDTAARDFEAMFIAEMMKPMMETVQTDEQFGGGKGEDVFRGLLTQEYGKKMAAAGGIGLASSIGAALLQAQESAGAKATSTTEGTSK